METVTLVLTMLLTVALTGVLDRAVNLPVPLPLTQILVGAALSAIPFGLHVELDPGVTLFLFVAPLLFVDAWRIPKREFYRLRHSILLLALGLVLFTVVGIGLLVHWLIPSVPLAAAFALAAVLAPTDAVAVSSISRTVRIPGRLLVILEGEALLNDATGLVSFKFAVAAALTGTFSLGQAALSFLAIAVGGIGVGLAFAWAFGIVLRKITDIGGEEPTTRVLLVLLVPFAAYQIAEHLGLSGILAVVAAGIACSNVVRRFMDHGATRMQATAMWNMVGFTFNGMVFLLLGLQLPQIVTRALAQMTDSDGIPFVHLLLDGLVVALALTVLRFVWVAAALTTTILRRRGPVEEVVSRGLRIVLATTFSGVRGAVTLAGILSLPLVMSDGAPFPGRDLLIFIAADVIVLSLVSATILLPPSLKGLRLPSDEASLREERQAGILSARAAIRAIEHAWDDVAVPDDDADLARCAEIGGHILTFYRRRIQAAEEVEKPTNHAQRDADIERTLLHVGLEAERGELHRLRETHKINDATLRKLLVQVDALEMSLAPSGAARQ